MIIEQMFFAEQAARLKKMAEEEKRQKAAFRKKVRSSRTSVLDSIQSHLNAGLDTLPHVCLDGERGVRFYSR